MKADTTSEELTYYLWVWEGWLLCKLSESDSQQHGPWILTIPAGVLFAQSRIRKYINKHLACYNINMNFRIGSACTTIPKYVVVHCPMPRKLLSCDIFPYTKPSIMDNLQTLWSPSQSLQIISNTPSDVKDNTMQHMGLFCSSSGSSKSL